MVDNHMEKLNALLHAKKPVTLVLIAKELQCTAHEAAHVLPSENCAFVRQDVGFETVWSELCTWERVTFFVIHEGHVFEIVTKLSPGKSAMGYYNILHADATLGGHIKADAIADMAFISMPFMGRESHYVAFFGLDGSLHFSVYVGRDNHQLVDSVKDAFTLAKVRFCDGV